MVLIQLLNFMIRKRKEAAGCQICLLPELPLLWMGHLHVVVGTALFGIRLLEHGKPHTHSLNKIDITITPGHLQVAKGHTFWEDIMVTKQLNF